jgi:4-hydroxythreonine-4-phosphate dehydrogenase
MEGGMARIAFSNELPLIGITMGDPSGVGPEIILKALCDARIYGICRPVVLGDPEALSAGTRACPGMTIHFVEKPHETQGLAGRIDLVPVSRLKRNDVMPAKPTARGGKAMVDYILKAVRMAQDGELAAIVTCPISKTLMHEAGYHFEGHTQLISQMTGTRDYVMMLAGKRLRVALVTTHCPLKEVSARLDIGKIYRTILITFHSLRKDFGISVPRLAVAALNPHAGESGLFGSEEREIIEPAMRRAQREGCTVEGPFPADTLFHRACSGLFDAVVAMYHDQGLIPLKLLHFSDAVNVTLGLPVIRTSVDHGTAYDIAGKGVADPSSLRAAIKMAVMMAKNRAYP